MKCKKCDCCDDPMLPGQEVIKVPSSERPGETLIICMKCTERVFDETFAEYRKN